jgi:ubiquinone/menaquinone biosynthesis C-methylase UbiE
MKKHSKHFSENLVQRVNELYFDFNSEKYHNSRPEIFVQEKDRWEKIGRHFLCLGQPLKIVDVGTGTGFVPLVIGKFLKRDDIFICSDISKDILDTAKCNIIKQNFHCLFNFSKVDSKVPFQLPFDNESMDVVTMNSVLHHIKDTDVFLGEVDRILKPKGLLFIAHEPNRYFYESHFLWYTYLFAKYLTSPQLILVEILQKLHLEKAVEHSMALRKTETKFDKKNGVEEIVNRINVILLNEKLIEKPLTLHEIDKIKDIKADEGFLANQLLPKYRMLFFESYNHISWVTIQNFNNFFIRKYNGFLQRKYPEKGATFFAVLEKPGLFIR